MSIQTYNQQLLYDERLVAPNTDPLPPIGSGVGMEFQVDLMVTVGHDKTAKKSSTFTIVGSGENGNTTYDNCMLADLLQAGSVFASTIAALSKGVICGFYAKLGKFRPDVVPKDVPAGDNSYIMCDMTNNINDAYGMDPCDRIAEFPVENAGCRIYIPWIRDDVSRQDVIDTLEQFEYTANGVSYCLGQIKFNNVEKTSMTAFPTDIVRNVKLGLYSRKTPAYRANNDSAMGMASDHVLSEKYNDRLEGVDDMPNGE